MENRYQSFTLLISNINRCIHKIKTEEIGRFNLKAPHVSCLYYLYQENSITATQLCEICGEDKAAISRTLDYLETNGYITRDSKTLKKYRSPIVLTHKGKEVGQFISDRIEYILEEASNGLSEEKRQILYESLTLIHDNLNHICEDYKK